MEPRFGRDLSEVRIHAGAEAAKAASGMHARAYTAGRDVVFGADEYAPGMPAGRRLLAHELAHFAQQAGGAPARGAIGSAQDPAEAEADRAADAIGRGAAGRVALSAQPARIRRAPSDQSSTQKLHEDLIEQFRAANGLPPHGIDPITRQQIGPTDSEIRFGGLLEAWLRNPAQTAPAQASPAAPAQAPAQAPAAAPAPAQAPAQTPATVRSVAAPAQAPTITGVGNTNVVTACQGAPDIGSCREHQNYVQNILPQAIANIRAVSSPYSAAIAALYTAALPAAQAAAAPVPMGPWVNAAGGSVTVTFGSTQHTFTQFDISLQQWPGRANGQAFGAGGSIASINLNESSNDAMLRNISGIEATMVHETMHIFMEIVETTNAARAAGTAMIEPNLDRASYATIKTSLEAALLPFVTQIRALPSFSTRAAPLTAQKDAEFTASSFLSETIARAEAGIYAKQRAGQAFTAADLRALPAFIGAASYWSPTPPVNQELETFLLTNQPQLDAAIQPLIFQAGERYLNLRP
jgi:Domain of unknown function (DUF4157)